LTILIILGDEYSLCRFPQPPVSDCTKPQLYIQKLSTGITKNN
jgi:hypothetical protein